MNLFESSLIIIDFILFILLMTSALRKLSFFFSTQTFVRLKCQNFPSECEDFPL